MSKVAQPCSGLVFLLSGTVIFADQSTQYRGGTCSQVVAGRAVFVVGQTQSDGRVKAQRIDLK